MASKPKQVRKSFLTNLKLPCTTPGCNEVFTRYAQLNEHIDINHQCRRCGISELDIRQHQCIQGGFGDNLVPANLDIHTGRFVRAASAHGGTLLVYKLSPTEHFCQVEDIFNEVQVELTKLLDVLIKVYSGINVTFTLLCDMLERRFDVLHRNTSIGTPWTTISHKNFINDSVLRAGNYIVDIINSYQINGSDWVLNSINELSFMLGEYVPIQGQGWVKLSKDIGKNGGLLNIEYHGKRAICFQLCVMAFLHREEIKMKFLIKRRLSKKKQTKEAERKAIERFFKKPVEYLKYLDRSEVDFSNLTCEYDTESVNINRLDIFETNNPELSVNVYGHLGKKIFPYRLTKSTKQKHIDLLLVHDEDELIYHFVLITDLSRLLGCHNKSRHLFCRQCLKTFIGPETLMSHYLTCRFGNNAYQVITPSRKPYIMFDDYSQTLKMPFAVYIYIHGNYIYPEGKLTPVAYSYILISDNNFGDIGYYKGEDCIEHLLRTLLKLSDFTINVLKTKNVINSVTPEELQGIYGSKYCLICQKPFYGATPRLHHNHYTGYVYKQGLHNSCNLIIKHPRRLYVLGYDLSKYLPFICMNVNKVFPKSHVKPIYTSGNKMTGLHINKRIRINCIENYIPSNSLCEIASTHINPSFDFNHVYKVLKITPDELKTLLASNLDFPNRRSAEDAENVDVNAEWDKFVEVYDDEVDSTALTQFNTFNALNKLNKDVVDSPFLTFMKLKVLVLAELFEDVRRFLFDNNNLDLIYSWSISTYSLNSALYFNRIQLEKVQCLEMRELVLGLIRGGISVLTTKHVKVNSSGYGTLDKNIKQTQFFNSDINMCYSYAMLSDLPYGDFEWMSDSELKDFDFVNPPSEDMGYGYIFKVELETPVEKMQDFDKFPLWNSKVNVSYQYELSGGGGVSWKSTDRTLSTLYPLSGPFYYLSIKLMLELGLKLIKVEKGIKFTVKKIFAPYVEKNIERRYLSISKLWELFWKLLNNILAGKVLTSKFNYPTSEMCFSATRAKFNLSRHLFKDAQIINEGMSIFQFNKATSNDDNLRIIGAVILEKAKIRLYELYYKHIVPAFTIDGLCHVKLCLCNTDSLMCIVDLDYDDFIKVLKSLDDVFDFSNLKDSVIFSLTNKNKPGMLKMNHFDRITEFVGIRSNQYSFKLLNADKEETYQKLSGCPTSLNSLKHDELKKVVFKHESKDVKFKSLVKRGGELFLVSKKKVCFTSLDISRFWFSQTESLSFGNPLIENFNTNDESVVQFEK